MSEADAAAYAGVVLREVQIGLDEKVLPLTLAGTSFPALEDVKNGIGVVRIEATAAIAPLSVGKHTVTLANAHLPAISDYLVNALAPKDRAIKITNQFRDDLQQHYRLEFVLSRPSASARPARRP